MEALRASGTYAVVTPEECVAMARSNGSLRLHPPHGGPAPELAWESLELVATKVLPGCDGPRDHRARGRPGRSRGNVGAFGRGHDLVGISLEQEPRGDGGFC